MPPSRPGGRGAVAAILAGGALGYLAGGLAYTAQVGAWSETLKRYLYKLQGGGGEGLNWGEPMFYGLLMLALPSAWTLGQFFRMGEGVPKDLRRAVESYEKGCAVGFGGACNRLGLMHQHGEGVVASAPVALGFFAKGCDAGHAEACREVGLLQQRGGPDVPKDPARAHEALQKACALRDGWSCFTVGLMYERADGVPRDFPQAAAFYQKACDIPYAMGCVYLGDSYTHGEGVARDDARAASLYIRAAGLLEQDCGRGDGHGCHALGTLYRTGQGVAADAARARGYFEQGCRAGYKEACAAAGR